MILLLRRDLGLATDAEHARDRVAVDVAVECAGALALGGQGRGEVGGHRRLADAALARGDADHVLDLGQGAFGQAPPAELLLELSLLGVGEDVEADLYLVDAFELGDLLDHGLLEVVADRAAGGRQRDDDLDAAVVADLDRADHAELDDVLAQLGVDDRAGLLVDLFACWHGRHVSEQGCRPERREAGPRAGFSREERLLLLLAR